MADPVPQVTRDVTISHKEGLHTRPVMRFVDLAQRFASTVRVASLANESEVVDGKSAMELMLLGATCGTQLRIVAVGADASDAVDALVQLVEDHFEIDS